MRTRNYSLFRDGMPANGVSSFTDVSDEEIGRHIGVRTYEDFTLTEAVRPAYNLRILPMEGYKREIYKDRETNVEVPVIMAAASREKLWNLFHDLLAPLGNDVDVVLETSHERVERSDHDDLYRENIDTSVLQSTLYDFEELLMDDGCTGIAVLNPRIPLEIQFDEHKLLIIYGHTLSEFEEILFEHGIFQRDDMEFITEEEHIHITATDFMESFDQLIYRLGVDQGEDDLPSEQYT